MIVEVYVSISQQKVTLRENSAMCFGKEHPNLYHSYSDHFNLSTVGLDPGHSTLWRIIFASDDTQKHITLRVTPLGV